jgi:hypothetical protein
MDAEPEEPRHQRQSNRRLWMERYIGEMATAFVANISPSWLRF